MFLENGTFSYPFLLFCGPQAATPFEEWTYGLSLASAFLATGCAFWGLNYSVGQLSTNKCRFDRQGWVWGLAWGMLGEIWLALLGSEYFSINGSLRFHKLRGPGPSIQDEVDKVSPKLEAPRSLKHSHPKMEAPRASKHTIDFFHFTLWCHHHHVNNDSSTVLIPSNTSCFLIPNLSSSGLPVLFLLLGFRSHPALI